MRGHHLICVCGNRNKGPKAYVAFLQNYTALLASRQATDRDLAKAIAKQAYSYFKWGAPGDAARDEATLRQIEDKVVACYSKGMTTGDTPLLVFNLFCSGDCTNLVKPGAYVGGMRLREAENVAIALNVAMKQVEHFIHASNPMVDIPAGNSPEWAASPITTTSMGGQHSVMITEASDTDTDPLLPKNKHRQPGEHSTAMTEIVNRTIRQCLTETNFTGAVRSFCTKNIAIAVLVFFILAMIILYFLQRFEGVFNYPCTNTIMPPPPPHSFNSTAFASFNELPPGDCQDIDGMIAYINRLLGTGGVRMTLANLYEAMVFNLKIPFTQAMATWRDCNFGPSAAAHNIGEAFAAEPDAVPLSNLLSYFQALQQNRTLMHH